MLKIARIDVYGYDLTYVYGSYTMSGGRVIDSLPSTVVRVTTTDGVKGFGEVCPLGPAYLPSHGEGARAALRLLAPAVVGLSAANLGSVSAAMGRSAASGALVCRGTAAAPRRSSAMSRVV